MGWVPKELRTLRKRQRIGNWRGIAGFHSVAIAPVGYAALTGAITPYGAVNEAQTVTFTFDDLINPPTSQTITLAADGSYSISGLPQGNYNVGGVGSKWLRKTTKAVWVSPSGATLNATILPGDLNGDNQIDLRSSLRTFVKTI